MESFYFFYFLFFIFTISEKNMDPDASSDIEGAVNVYLYAHDGLQTYSPEPAGTGDGSG